jgi:ATP-binding cassette, subfamily B, bacterial
MKVRSFRSLFAGLGQNLRQTYRLVWDGARSQVLLGLALELLLTLATVGQLALVRRLLAQLRGGAATGSFDRQLFITILVSGVLAATVAAIGAVQMFIRPLAVEMLTRHTYAKVLERLRTSPLEDFDEPAFHDRLERLAKEGVDRPAELVWAASGLIAALIGIVGIGFFVTTIMPEVMPMVLIGSVPLLIASRVDAQAYYRYVQSLGSVRRRTQYLRDVLTDRKLAPELLGYDLRSSLEARHEVLQQERINRLAEMVRARSIRSVFTALATVVVTVAALCLIAYRATNGQLSLDEAIAVVLGVQQLSGRLGTLRAALSVVQQNRLFLTDLYGFLDATNDVDGVVAPGAPDGPSAGASVGVAPAIELRNVRFRYPAQTRDAVDSIDLHVPAGQVVAFVGENGSGKTTLAKLIAGLYRPTSGSVIVGGKDLSDLPQAARTTHAVTVFQDFARFALSARDNISIADQTRPHDDVRLAASIAAAGLDSVVAGLPRGLDTTLAAQFDDGVDLSSGQWQRFALARAFYRDAPVLLLDEPTAALDARSEYLLFERVREIARGRTVILISHRLASVRGVDRIVVMRNGRIVETGTHADLIEAGGLYAELTDLQERTSLANLD